jgi:hypothetical protein
MIESKIETKHIIAELSVTEKICLYNALYEDLAGKGTEGDTELAHVNKAEMAVLRTMGGSGTVNPNTGLIQFGGGSPPPPPPSNTSVSQTSEFPAELKPFIQDVLGKSQAIQEKRESEGYIPFEGPQIAEFSPEQEQAFTGIQGLVGQGQEYFDPSADLAKSSTGSYTPEAVRAAMSPYTQNVVDIQQREALRQADVAQQRLAAQAAGAGGLGGSRMAIQEAEQNRNTQQLLSDIQARGQAAAFEDAQTRLLQQSGRELAASGQLMNLGSVAPQQALKEYTAVEAIGAQKQAQTQQALNIAKNQFQEEQTFPEQTLQQYQSVIRGFPLAPNTYTNSQTVNPAPSYLQQAAGIGGLGLGVASAFGGFGKAQGGLVSRMQGGPVDQNRGLGSIVVRRQAGQLVNLSVEELEALVANPTTPSLQKQEATKLLQGKNNMPEDDADNADNTPFPFTPPPKAQAPAVTKPTYGSLDSLRDNKNRDAYFAKATEVLGKREKRLLDKMDDPSDKYEYLADLLSKFAGGTRGADFGELAIEVAPQASAGAKELRKDREGLQEKAEDTSLQIGKLGAEQEAADKELEAKVYIELQKNGLDDKDRADIILAYAKATELRSLNRADIKSMLDGIRDPAARRSLKILLESEIKGIVGKGGKGGKGDEGGRRGREATVRQLPSE